VVAGIVNISENINGENSSMERNGKLELKTL
jgi:hypothetical protein